MSRLETLNDHPCVIWISSCPLLKCTAMTGNGVLLSQWTIIGLFFVFFIFYFFRSFVFHNHSMFYFHEKNKFEFQTVWLRMSDGKLHFWGGVCIVGPSFVTVHLLAPVSSLNGSSPSDVTVRQVWAGVWWHCTYVLDAWNEGVKGADWYWRMCLGRLGVLILR